MKKGLFITLGAGFSLLIALVMIFSPVKKPTIPTTAPTPTPILAPNQTGQINYNALFSNKIVAEGMSKKLSNPDKATQQDGYNVFSYKTDVPQRHNLLYLQGNTAKYFVEQITTDNTHYTDFLTKNPGVQPQMLYDTEFANTGFVWVIFPDQGVAFLTNQGTGYATKILYFPQTTYQNFLQTAAKTFSLTTTDPTAEEKDGFGIQP